jgi:hypothetical protein
MTSTIDVKQVLQGISLVLFAVAAIDILILLTSVVEGDQEAVGRWMVRHFESMMWLTVAESLGLTGTAATVAAPLLKAFSRR